MTIDNAVDEFLFHCAYEAAFSENTVQAYRSDLNHFRSFLGDVDLNDAANADHLKAYLQHMLKSSVTVGINRSQTNGVPSMLFQTCSPSKMTSPTHFLNWSPSLKRPRRLPRALSQAEAQSLFAPLQDLDSTMLETAWLALLISSTGVRVSELCAMFVADVFEDGRGIRIRGKGARERVVFVGDDIIASELASLRSIRAPFGQRAAMFLNSRGRQLTAQAFRRRLHKVRSAGNLKRTVTPHMLRHTAATLLIEKGADIRYVQRLLGHSSIATTEIYTHVTDTALQNALRQANPIAELRPRQTSI